MYLVRETCLTVVLFDDRIFQDRSAKMIRQEVSIDCRWKSIEQKETQLLLQKVGLISQGFTDRSPTRYFGDSSPTKLETVHRHI